MTRRKCSSGGRRTRVPKADLRTSTYLQDQLSQLDAEYPPEDVEPIPPEDIAAVRKWQKMLVESLIGLSSKDCERVHHGLSTAGDACAYMLDDYFARHLVAQMPSIVVRIRRFEPVVVPDGPPKLVNLYLSEAVRCYIFGLNQGAVTLARAAVEQGLRERVPYAGQMEWTLKELIKAAEKFKLLEPAYLQMAKNVQNRGNQVLHSKPCDSGMAREALNSARAVLENLLGEGR